MLLFSAQTVFGSLKKAGYRRYILLLVVLTLHACGFQLRGALDLSPDISPVYFQQNQAFELGRIIKSVLETNRIAISEYANTANSRLVILKESRARRVLSVDSNGRAKEYLLTYTVRFTIKLKDQEAAEESVVVSRSLLFDPDAVIAVDNEAEVLYKDMKQDAARLILLKLQAYSRNPAAVKPVNDKEEADKSVDNLAPVSN